jgi:hypothetical protein
MNIKFQGATFYISHPNICPHCHVVNNPAHIWSSISVDTDSIPVYISSWQCANNECNKLFIAIHKKNGSQFIFSRFLNGLPKGPDWPVPIAKLKSGNQVDGEEEIKSRFIKTYLQSLEAENYGLDELAGMGYRKAIEYLVKDWAIQNKPDDKVVIEGLWLGEVIKKYYDGDLKEILERATWLGNDQAHYNKLFEEYDLEILKELIDLIMVELDRQFKKAHYIETITKRK